MLDGIVVLVRDVVIDRVPIVDSEDETSEVSLADAVRVAVPETFPDDDSVPVALRCRLLLPECVREYDELQLPVVVNETLCALVSVPVVFDVRVSDTIADNEGLIVRDCDAVVDIESCAEMVSVGDAVSVTDLITENERDAEVVTEELRKLDTVNVREGTSVGLIESDSADRVTAPLLVTVRLVLDVERLRLSESVSSCEPVRE